MKLEHGSSAVGVSVVKDEVELKNKHHEISESLQTNSDFPGIGLGHDNSMIAMEFHTGSEHDVDVIMYDRKLVGAFISDNGPTRRPYFTGNLYFYFIFLKQIYNVIVRRLNILLVLV